MYLKKYVKNLTNIKNMIKYNLVKRGKAMKVYRIANRLEIDKFLENKSFNNVGSTFNETP